MLLTGISSIRNTYALFGSGHWFDENIGKIRISKTNRITRFLILLISSLVMPLYSYSQGEFNNWYFGIHAGITFINGAPVALTNCENAFQQNFAICTESEIHIS